MTDVGWQVVRMHLGHGNQRLTGGRSRHRARAGELPAAGEFALTAHAATYRVAVRRGDVDSHTVGHRRGRHLRATGARDEISSRTLAELRRTKQVHVEDRSSCS